jgi:Tfp pilus assembly major pilin PilA
MSRILDAARELTKDKEMKERKGTLVDQGIGVMVSVIVIGAVAIPVVQDVLAQTNLSGTAETVVGFVPLALGLALFVASISMIR